MKSMQFVQRSSHGHGHDHESLVHRPKGDPFAKDECTLYCQKHVKCCGRDCKYWLLWIIGLATSAVVFGVLFVVFASLYGASEDSNTQCRLTYTDGGVITEQEMMDWSKHNAWPLRHPKWNDHLKTCTCNSKAYDPTALSNTDEVDVWLAPGDMVDLSRFGIHLPTGFATKYSGAFAREDHVKVCLRYGFLVDLWGNQTVGHHCHNATQTDASNPLQTRPFIAYDGALWCAEQKKKPLSDYISFVMGQVPKTKKAFDALFGDICPKYGTSASATQIASEYFQTDLTSNSIDGDVYMCQMFYRYTKATDTRYISGSPFIIDVQKSTNTFINPTQLVGFLTDQSADTSDTASGTTKYIPGAFKSVSSTKWYQVAGLMVQFTSLKECLTTVHDQDGVLDDLKARYEYTDGDKALESPIPCLSFLRAEPYVMPIMKYACGSANININPMLTDRWKDTMVRKQDASQVCLRCGTTDMSDCDNVGAKLYPDDTRMLNLIDLMKDIKRFFTRHGLEKHEAATMTIGGDSNDYQFHSVMVDVTGSEPMFQILAKRQIIS